MPVDSLTQARTLLSQGNHADAYQLLKSLSERHANNPEYLLLYAISQHQIGYLKQAVHNLNRVCSIDSENILAHVVRAQLSFERGNFLDALNRYIQLLEKYPQDLQHLFHIAVVLRELGRLDEAAACYREILQQEPRHYASLLNLGTILSAQDNYREAVEHYETMSRYYPEDANVHANLGDIWLAVGDFSQAFESIEKALLIDPNHLRAQIDLCITNAAVGEYEAAQQLFEHLNRQHHDELQPILARLGFVIHYPDQLDFRHVWLFIAFKRHETCNWLERQELVNALQQMCDDPEAMKSVSAGYVFFLMSLPVNQQTRIQFAHSVADRVTTSMHRNLNRPLFKHTANPNQATRRLKIAYIGTVFRQHPAVINTHGIYAAHDRQQFEVYVYALNKIDDSDDVRHVADTADYFLEMSEYSDVEVAKHIYDQGIDILIDLAVYNDGGRTAVLAMRPAPVQMSWIATEMTSGSDFYDYHISDEIIIGEDRKFWTENIIYLPDSCFPYSNQRAVDTSSDRNTEGLPEDAFVFCAFNNNYKISPEMFDVWCRLLNKIPDSILWLISNNRIVQNNILREAKERGIEKDRIVFAERIDTHAAHLGRQKLADLFLDTNIYNAHSTAMESVYVGLPLLTLQGEAAASRVASSVLTAVGLTELITHSLDEYEAMAYRLAIEEGLLQAIRSRLEAFNQGTRLYDSNNTARKLELAYRQAWERYCQGQPAADFHVKQ